MAMPETIVQRWNEMTGEEQAQAVDFIDYLLMKRKYGQQSRKTHFQFDALAGGLEYIADDFDETPEEFREYMTDENIWNGYDEVSRIW